MEKVTSSARPPGTVHCAWCMAGYEPTPEQALVLTGLRAVPGWTKVAARYATETAGWYQRTDGLLLCHLHADRGDQPPPTRPTPP